MKLNINDEQGIELLHFIFERELKPPFSKMVMKPPVNRYGILGDGNYDCEYYNRDNEHIGWSKSTVNYFKFNFNELLNKGWVKGRKIRVLI